jgi:CHASE3 domain sensor protein
MYQLKRKLKKLEDTFKDKISNSLFENNDSNLKNGLIANEVLAYQGKQKIEEAKRTLYNIEDNGKQALNSLEKQTNSMKAVNVKIAGMNDDLENSNNLLNKMKIRYQRNKRQILIFGIILILIIALIIVWKILFK